MTDPTHNTRSEADLDSEAQLYEAQRLAENAELNRLWSWHEGRFEGWLEARRLQPRKVLGPRRTPHQPPPDGLKTTAQADLPHISRRQRTPRRPSLTRIAAQAKKAGINVARIEVAADGSYTVVSKDEFTTESNPWLADLRKETKQ